MGTFQNAPPSCHALYHTQQFLKYISDVSELGMTGQREQEEKKEKSNKTAFLLEAGTQISKIKQVPSSIPGTDDKGFLL